jgi:hypothetical protein
MRLRVTLGGGEENCHDTRILELTNDFRFRNRAREKSIPPTLYKHGLCSPPPHVNELYIAGRSLSAFLIKCLLIGSILLSNMIFYTRICGVKKGYDEIFYCRPGTGNLLREEVIFVSFLGEKDLLEGRIIHFSPINARKRF